MTAEVATEQETGSGNIIANVNIYWRVSAIALAVVALLGIVVNAIGGNNAYVPDVEFMESFLVFDWTHNVVHVLLAGVAGAFGFGNFSPKLSANVAKVIGVVYIALGFLGFVPPVTDFLSEFLGLSLEVGENLIHLVLGAWGAYAGFTA